ncbi:MAG: toll/interleukin-1 receptor domain-containing protein [bacterium]|nr:toll/interleukin-1 receptor domain-containing protein [bacterium]
MSKIFISYAKEDRSWAEWIAWTLEEEGHSVTLQAWDYKPGHNFVLEMDKATAESDKTIAVLSKDYMKTVLTQPEWAAAFLKDPAGQNRGLIPVRVNQFEPRGLLKSIAYIDFVDLTQAEAKNKLLEGINQERSKPRESPTFPGDSNPFRASEDAGKPEGQSVPKTKVFPERLPKSQEFFGREEELSHLTQAWENKTRLLTILSKPEAGIGKTALLYHWLERMKKQNYKGAEKVYVWSFGSRGTPEGKQTSPDLFFRHALEWFGAPIPTEGSAVDKARRLATYIKNSKTLLILLDIESLLFPSNVNPYLKGRFKNQEFKIFIKEIAHYQQGLCIMTTLSEITDLSNDSSIYSKHIEIRNLSLDAGIALLKSQGLVGQDSAFRNAFLKCAGHALSLSLLGRYLKAVHNGDIEKQDRILSTDETTQSETVLRIIKAYEKWLGESPELDIIRIMGLFDKPVKKAELDVLMAEPSIPGITGYIRNCSKEAWNKALTHLRALGILMEENPHTAGMLDCLPIVRQYFSQQIVNKTSKSWEQAHQCLYHYYIKLAEKELPDTRIEMQPLFSAVNHGCKAGLHQEVFDNIYSNRIRRREKAYIVKKLSAFNADLEILSHFFDEPWTLPSPELSIEKKLLLLNWAAFDFRALGSLQDALRLMEICLEADLENENWAGASADAETISKLELTLGGINEAVKSGEESLNYAHRCKDDFAIISSRATLANALHQSGKRDEAEKHFKEAEDLQRIRQPQFKYLYSVRGFQYCELLLEQKKYEEVLERGKAALEVAEKYLGPLDIALSNLTLAYRGYGIMTENKKGLSKLTPQETLHLFSSAVDFARQSGYQEYLARCLLGRAAFYHELKKVEYASEDLREAHSIAKIGSMDLLMADFHIEASLNQQATGNKEGAREHLNDGKVLCQKMNYQRRYPDIAELEVSLSDGLL